MTKIIMGVAIVLVLGGLVYYFFFRGAAPEPTPQQPVTQEPTTSTYASTTLGASIQYPKDYTFNEAYAYPFGSKTIAGVKFTVPATMATGTNLSADSGVSLEVLPRANNCTADIFILPNVRATTESLDGKQYSTASTSDAGAGNLHEEFVFAIPGSKPCVAVRYLIHTTQLSNYPAGTVRAYDRAALLQQFDTIRHSLVLQSAASPATPTP